MGKTWAKIVGAFTILAGLIALAEWLGLQDEWKLAAQGFVVGMMVVALPVIWAWDSPYRREKLARERKKLDLVQALPSRAERVHDLRAASDQLQVEIAKARAKVETQSELATGYWRKGNDFFRMAHESASKDAEHDVWLKQHEWERLQEEYLRMSALTDDEWREEQVAKIHVPE